MASSNGSDKGLMTKLDNYIIVDIGANLTNKKYARDLDAVVDRAKEAGETFFYCSISMSSEV